MIAIFGLVGGQHFAARYVISRKEGEAWHAAHLALIGEDQSTLSAFRQSDVFTDAVAQKVRYRDRTCPFGHYRHGVWQWTVENVATADARIKAEQAALAELYGDGSYEFAEWEKYQAEQRAESDAFMRSLRAEDKS